MPSDDGFYNARVFGAQPRVANSECECEGCSAVATTRVEAQWSIADWDWADVCEPHIDRTIRYFEARTVDGKPPLEYHVDPLGRR